MSVNYVSSDFM